MSTGFLKSRDDTKLFWRSWPVDGARAAVAIIHGYAEHSGRYEHVAAHLNEAGYYVAAVDLRGHGTSEGARGHITAFSEYLADVDALIRAVGSEAPDIPLFLLGHSMGGLVAFRYAGRDPEGLAGLILSSPYFDVSIKVPAWKRGAGHVLSKLLPGTALPSGLPASAISHDAAVVAAYENDPMIFDTATARWFTETTEAQARALPSARTMGLPLLIQAAGDDRIVDLAATRAISDAYAGEDRTLRIYEALFHEIFNEVKKDEPLTDLVEWLSAH